MQIYSIFEPVTGPVQPDDPRSVIFLKQGFSWPALLVPLLWLFYHRMWMLAGAYFGLSAALALLGQWLDPQGVAATILGLSSGLMVACEANGLRRWHLSRSGYREVASIAAPNLAEAELRYFSARPDATPAPAAPVRVTPGTERRRTSVGWGFMAPDTRS